MKNESSLILLVDDDSNARELLYDLLQPQGYRLIQATNGPEALRLAASYTPDLMLLDVMMPDMDGYEVCQRVRADSRLSEIPVIMVTALDDRESLLRGIEVGADDFLSKPIDRVELRLRVRTITRLNRYRLLLNERARADLLEGRWRQITFELHDGIAQQTVGLYQQLQRLMHRYRPRSAEARQALQLTLETSQRLISETRRIIAGLRPAALDDFGLSGALRLQAESLRSAGWQVIYEDQLSPQRLTAEVETALFRIAQEALTNIHKHAGPTSILIQLVKHDTEVQLRVRDWGRGFLPDVVLAMQNTEHLGLQAMHERINLVGGELQVVSAPGQGTEIIARLPQI